MNSNHISFSILDECTITGSAGYELVAGDEVALDFGENHLWVLPKDRRPLEIHYVEIVELLINGPGAVTTGGGFFGGGFGVDGALTGIAVATVLNSITSRTKIHTHLSLITNSGELHVHYAKMEPGALRIELASVFTALRRNDSNWVQARNSILRAKHAAHEISDGELSTFTARLMARGERADLSKRSGVCPSCESVIPLLSSECPKCKAMFGPASAWRVRPI